MLCITYTLSLINQLSTMTNNNCKIALCYTNPKVEFGKNEYKTTGQGNEEACSQAQPKSACNYLNMKYYI